jgi:hypothetical protein
MGLKGGMKVVSEMTKIAIKTLIDSMLSNYSNSFVMKLVLHDERNAEKFASLFKEQKDDLCKIIDNIDEEDGVKWVDTTK